MDCTLLKVDTNILFSYSSIVMIKRIKKFFYKVLSLAFHAVPLQDIVVLNSFQGRGFGDDPKYIALEILRRKEKVKLVWLVENINDKRFPEGIIRVHQNSLLACYYLTVAKVWIDNCRGISSKVFKRKGQFYIQTWHCTFGLKKLGTDNEKSSMAAKEYVRRDMQNVNLMYSNSDFRVEKYKTTFWYEGPVLKCDVPRVAFIKNQPHGLKEHLCKEIGIDKNMKIAMYAPTFRDDDTKSVDVYKYDFLLLVQALERRFGGSFVLLLRLHPNLRNIYNPDDFCLNDVVVDVTYLPDMEELLCVTDILFTDFSSSMFDFSIAGKPVVLVAKDYQHYIEKDRGLYFNPQTDLPFVFCESQDELIHAIRDFDEEAYKKRCNTFYNQIGLEDKGNGDKQIADIVLNHLK